MIHSLPWITIFGSLVMRFANDFHSWLRHSWKLLAHRLTRDPKIVIHGNSCIFLYICHNMSSWYIGFKSPGQTTHISRASCQKGPLGRIPSISISKWGHHWFTYWLFVIKPLFHECWLIHVIINWALRNKLQWNFKLNTILFIQVNAFENVVYEMLAILSLPSFTNAGFLYYYFLDLMINFLLNFSAAITYCYSCAQIYNKFVHKNNNMWCLQKIIFFLS